MRRSSEGESNKTFDIQQFEYDLVTLRSKVQRNRYENPETPVQIEEDRAQWSEYDTISRDAKVFLLYEHLPVVSYDTYRRLANDVWKQTLDRDSTREKLFFNRVPGLNLLNWDESMPVDARGPSRRGETWGTGGENQAYMRRQLDGEDTRPWVNKLMHYLDSYLADVFEYQAALSMAYWLLSIQGQGDWNAHISTALKFSLLNTLDTRVMPIPTIKTAYDEIMMKMTPSVVSGFMGEEGIVIPAFMKYGVTDPALNAFSRNWCARTPDGSSGNLALGDVIDVFLVAHDAMDATTEIHETDGMEGFLFNEVSYPWCRLDQEGSFDLANRYSALPGQPNAGGSSQDEREEVVKYHFDWSSNDQSELNHYGHIIGGLRRFIRQRGRTLYRRYAATMFDNTSELFNFFGPNGLGVLDTVFTLDDVQNYVKQSTVKDFASISKQMGYGSKSHLPAINISAYYAARFGNGHTFVDGAWKGDVINRKIPEVDLTMPITERAYQFKEWFRTNPNFRGMGFQAYDSVGRRQIIQQLHQLGAEFPILVTDDEVQLSLLRGYADRNHAVQYERPFQNNFNPAMMKDIDWTNWWVFGYKTQGAVANVLPEVSDAEYWANGAASYEYNVGVSAFRGTDVVEPGDMPRALPSSLPRVRNSEQVFDPKHGVIQLATMFTKLLTSGLVFYAKTPDEAEELYAHSPNRDDPDGFFYVLADEFRMGIINLHCIKHPRFNTQHPLSCGLFAWSTKTRTMDAAGKMHGHFDDWAEWARRRWRSNALDESESAQNVIADFWHTGPAPAPTQTAWYFYEDCLSYIGDAAMMSPTQHFQRMDISPFIWKYHGVFDATSGSVLGMDGLVGVGFPVRPYRHVQDGVIQSYPQIPYNASVTPQNEDTGEPPRVYVYGCRQSVVPNPLGGVSGVTNVADVLHIGWIYTHNFYRWDPIRPIGYKILGLFQSLIRTSLEIEGMSWQDLLNAGFNVPSDSPYAITEQTLRMFKLPRQSATAKFLPKATPKPERARTNYTDTSRKPTASVPSKTKADSEKAAKERKREADLKRKDEQQKKKQKKLANKKPTAAFPAELGKGTDALEPDKVDERFSDRKKKAVKFGESSLGSTDSASDGASR